MARARAKAERCPPECETEQHDGVWCVSRSGAFAPHVRGWSYDTVNGIQAMAKVDFFAYSSTFYGVNVSSANTDGDAYDEIVTGKGPGPSYTSQVKVFDYDNTAVMETAAFDAFASPNPYFMGVTVAGGDIDGSLPAKDEVVAGPGPDSLNPDYVRAFWAPSFTVFKEIDAFTSNLTRGTFVTAGTFGASKDLIVAGQVGEQFGDHATRLRGIYYDTATTPPQLFRIPDGNFHFESYGYEYGTTVAASRDPFQARGFTFAGGEGGTLGEREAILGVMRSLVAMMPDSTYACLACADPSPGIWNVWGADSQKKLLLDSIDAFLVELPKLTEAEVSARGAELARIAGDPGKGLTNEVALEDLLLQIASVEGK